MKQMYMINNKVIAQNLYKGIAIDYDKKTKYICIKLDNCINGVNIYWFPVHEVKMIKEA